VTRWPRAVLVMSILLSCVACDQTFKEAAERKLAFSEPVHLLGGVVRLEHVQNPGAFLSFGADFAEPLRFLLFVVVASLGLATCLVVLFRGRRWAPTTVAGLSLIVGGGLGNLIDRLLQGGAVTDYVSVGVGPLRTGIFNLADVAILTGTFLILVYRDQRMEPAPPAEPG
jgi:signal peptidase II